MVSTRPLIVTYYTVLSFTDTNQWIAKLARDQPTVRNYTSIYTNPDRAASDAAWQKLVRETEVGWVALDDKYSESIGLPHSVRWPWDDAKGIYVLSAAHELHCVVC